MRLRLRLRGDRVFLYDWINATDYEDCLDDTNLGEPLPTTFEIDRMAFLIKIRFLLPAGQIEFDIDQNSVILEKKFEGMPDGMEVKISVGSTCDVANEKCLSNSMISCTNCERIDNCGEEPIQQLKLKPSKRFQTLFDVGCIGVKNAETLFEMLANGAFLDDLGSWLKLKNSTEKTPDSTTTIGGPHSSNNVQNSTETTNSGLSVSHSNTTNGFSTVTTPPYNPRKECDMRRWSSTSESFVCVCNSTYCDQPEPVGRLQQGKAVLFKSDPVKLRLKRTELPRGGRQSSTNGNNNQTALFQIRVDSPVQFQKVFGFGGAFTDAAGFNMNTLSNRTRLNLLRAYFDKEIGIGYTTGRVPMASCDFSRRVYSYCDTSGDFQLKTFSLAREDLEIKIPFIRKAIELSGNRLRLFASPWSAPGWMKTTGKMPGGGSLRGNLNGPYYETYAHYFRRFFEEYSRVGNITFWGLTLQNEPYTGLNLNYHFQTMWISPEQQRDFADQILSPILKQSKASENVLIMAHDHNLDMILEAAKKIFDGTNDKSSSTIVSGLAYHWYSTNNGFGTGIVPDQNVLSQIHQLFPDKFLLSSEACSGWASDRGPSMGNWKRAQMYARDILRGLNNWAIGWTDWNLCLDQAGGPNWVNNVVDAPIITNRENDTFFKQPLFYAMAHFSRFVPPGSVRISSKMVVSDDSYHQLVEFVAFRTPTGDCVLVLLSNADHPVEVGVQEETVESGDDFLVVLPGKAFATLIWRPKQK